MQVELAWNPLDGEAEQVVVILTESQVTSYVADRLSKQSDPLIQQPQVYLRNGEIQIYGRAHQETWEANVAFIISPSLDAAGNLQLDVISAELGPFPAPDAVRESLSVILSEAFTGEVGPVATGIKLTSIAVADGEIALVGEVR